MLEKYKIQEPNKAEGPKTDYIGAFVYEDNELQFIQTSEGRLVPNGNGGFNYEYAIKGIPSTNYTSRKFDSQKATTYNSRFCGSNS